MKFQSVNFLEELRVNILQIYYQTSPLSVSLSLPPRDVKRTSLHWIFGSTKHTISPLGFIESKFLNVVKA